jgi:Bacterial extracellular solute-binding protein
MRPQKFAGLGLLLAFTLIIGGIKLYRPDPSPPVHGPNITVHGIIGKGKAAFLKDPDVTAILKDNYGLTVDVDKEVGSIGQVSECVQHKVDEDFCWPSSENAGEQIKAQVAPAMADSAFIFNSPIVMYTWTPIADALIAQGIVQKNGDTYWIVDFPKLVQMIDDHKQWSDIGLQRPSGEMIIYSTDPATSNTGNSFAGLLANTLDNNHVVDAASVDGVIPQVRSFFNGMGLLSETTATFFEQFLNLGMGAAPIIVAYESNLIEFSLQHQSAASQAYIRDNVRTIYPSPTVWSSQPLVALTPGGKRLMEALRDPEIQRIGWEHHGFRYGVFNNPVDPSIVNVPGVPATIDSVLKMPKPEIMERIVNALDATPTASKPEEPFT